jgi:hypothetical protein
VKCATGPPTAVIVKDPLTGFPLADSVRNTRSDMRKT